MGDIETRRVVVWSAYLDDELHQIGVSEDEVWRELKNNNESTFPI